MSERTLGKYTLLARLGQGGMAELHLAKAPTLGRDHRLAVVKLLNRRFARDPAFVEMFEDEMRIATLLTHPKIGQTYDVDREGGQPYLAMEFIFGQDLRQIIKRCQTENNSPLPLAIAIYIAAQICSALEYAHTATNANGTPLRIVHRDVSPSNIMVGYDGQVKLLDFGIAKAANRMAYTIPGLVKGKMRYLSPEQLAGMSVDQRTDIFILGVTLWEATVGRHLFAGDNEAAIYRAIAQGQITKPSDIRGDYPPQLEEIVLTALRKEPAERYLSARAMQAALESFANKSGLAIGEFAVSEFMRALFAREVDSWETDRAQGITLAEHLASSENRPPADQVEVVVSSDNRLSASRPSNDPPIARAERPTLRSKPPPSAEADKPKRTILYGGADPLVSENEPAVDQPPTRQDATTMRRLTPAPELRAIADRRPTQPDSGDQADSSDQADGDDQAPSDLLSRDPSVTAATAASPANQPPLEERSSTEQAGSFSAHGAPIVGPRLPRRDDSQPPRSANATNKPSTSRKPRTGDWSRQRASSSETNKPPRRTHPFFAEHQRQTDTGSLRIKRGPGLAIGIIVLAGVLLGGGVAAFFVLRRPASPSAVVEAGVPSDGQSPATAQPSAVQTARPVTQAASPSDASLAGGAEAGANDAMAADGTSDLGPLPARIEITSWPIGAAVYAVDTGRPRKLGHTPLKLVPAYVQSRRLQIFRRGYVPQLITIDERSKYHIRLRKAAKPLNDSLIDPF
ncbi:MAG: protein kinase [Deltaproteobacteria bacterium]|nr:protein kinase [Deltaproteobacteria bacterium]